MAITLEQAKQLKHGQKIEIKVSIGMKREAKTVTVKITSVKTWKTRPDQIRIRVKYGIFTHYELNENQLDQISLPKEIA